MIQYISKPFKYFFKLESASGLILLFAAILALIISNSQYELYYFETLEKKFKLGFNSFGLELSILHWINDVLMAIFFFLVSLEIKREFVKGELSNPKQAMLPIVGAVGGMLIPALFYIFFNWGDTIRVNGWAIPSATDIAFSLGVLSLLGKRVPISLKVFLTALAIIDDLGAIVIIAFFYSGNIQIKYLILMLVSLIILIILNKKDVKYFFPFLLVGILLWDFTHQSGIHATIAGVLLALSIPHNIKNEKKSMLLKIEHSISPYVAFGIMPIFAFANAGVSLDGLNLLSLLNPVPLGILCGLFFGKQIGVFVFSYLAIKLKFAEMPSNSNWISFYAVGVLTGIGFTMSLFVGNLAFANNLEYMDGVKIGVLSGSLLSTLFGYFLFLASPKNVNK
ncbi:MAG: Na+/H+ antiporter NhaA [Candidatus Pelagibacter sp.]|nr:Na+/H+ antiporter NhaA [Candidatus Pelagibacter sp.]|tara:strand:- start:523 stop:1704 length:1182 start_codon:yes stop_codon:yes gene_type:complete